MHDAPSKSRWENRDSVTRFSVILLLEEFISSGESCALKLDPGIILGLGREVMPKHGTSNECASEHPDHGLEAITLAKAQASPTATQHK